MDRNPSPKLQRATMGTEDITERDFEQVADETLRQLERALAHIDSIECDLQMGVLTIEFPDGARFIINSHRAAKQIWMAAGSTAWHFDPRNKGAEWHATKDGSELWTTVEAALSRKLATPVSLDRHAKL